MTINKTKRKNVAAMKVAGMTERAIATTTGLPKTTVHQIIHREFTPDQIAEFEGAEAKVLAGKRAMILDSLDHDNIKGASFRDKGVVYGILVDKQQQLEGKNPQAITGTDVRILIQMIQAAPVDNPTCQPNSDVIDVD
jgi:transposase